MTTVADPERRTVIRAAMSSYLIFGGIGIACSVIAVLDEIWTNVVISMGLSASLLLWIGSYRIILDGSQLTYRSFGSSFSFTRDEIAEIRPIFFFRSASPKPLAVEISLKGRTSRYKINLKPFSSSNVALIMCFLTHHPAS